MNGIPVFDGYDEALLGLSTQCGGEECACYDYEKLVEVTQRQFKCDQQEAQEYVDFNIVGCYINERTPTIVNRMTREEIDDLVSE